jgi:NADH:ubiquinone oxidoreductase subunit 4 (subunit M)
VFFYLGQYELLGTSTFIGEFPILVGSYQINSLVATLTVLQTILGAA